MPYPLSGSFSRAPETRIQDSHLSHTPCIGIRNMNRRGLTIVELIVVLAIISILMGLLFPAVQAARERARETVCKNNLHQMNLALAQLAEVQKRLPAPAPPGVVGGWMVEVLPFIEAQNLKDAIPQGLRVAEVTELLFKPPSVFRCPRRTALDGDLPPSVWPAHFVFVPQSRRESFSLFDAPVDLKVPWVSGPELPYDQIIVRKGPHFDGFHFVQGFQQGVGLMLNGQQIR